MENAQNQSQPEQLYVKRLHGKRTSYLPYQPATTPDIELEFTDAQCLTLAGSLGAVLLMTFERNIPPHKLVARKVKKLEEAILDVFNNTGDKVDPKIMELAFRVWDKTMKQMAAGVCNDTLH